MLGRLSQAELADTVICLITLLWGKEVNIENYNYQVSSYDNKFQVVKAIYSGDQLLGSSMVLTSEEITRKTMSALDTSEHRKCDKCDKYSKCDKCDQHGEELLSLYDKVSRYLPLLYQAPDDYLEFTKLRDANKLATRESIVRYSSSSLCIVQLKLYWLPSAITAVAASDNGWLSQWLPSSSDLAEWLS